MYKKLISIPTDTTDITEHTTTFHNYETTVTIPENIDLSVYSVFALYMYNNRLEFHFDNVKIERLDYINSEAASEGGVKLTEKIF